jgi:predicted ABC-type ATPase
VPNLFVIAGPNGAGKTTVAPRLLADHRRVEAFVNADNIAADLAGDAGSAVDFRAGRIMLRHLDELSGKGLDLAFETTLASRSLLPRIGAMRERGYLFHLIFLWLPSADMAVQRVTARVRDGGHSIQEAVVRRRYDRGLGNFFNRYRPIADSWLMLDNSGVSEPLLIAWRDVGGPVRIERDDMWVNLRNRYETDPLG